MIRRINNLKLKAFTLLELMVVMGVSGLIITSAFYVLNSYTSFLVDLEVQMEGKTDLYKWYQQLNVYVLQCREIKTNGDGFVFVFPDHEITYTIEGENLVSNFLEVKEQLPCEDIKTDFVFVNDNSSGLVKKIIIDLNYQGEEISWQLAKQYDAKTLMNFSKN